jgi:hypothetical protein
MHVAFGVEMAAQPTIDTGMKRSFADALKLKGETNCTALAAVTRRAYLWNQGYRRAHHAKAKGTIAQLSKFLHEHPELRDSANLTAQLHTKIPLAGSTISLCHWLFNGIEAEDTAWFFERLADGANLAAQHPINVLRKSLLEVLSSRRSVLDVDISTAWTIKAWNAYREGREISLLRWRPGGKNPEAFPEPI